MKDLTITGERNDSYLDELLESAKTDPDLQERVRTGPDLQDDILSPATMIQSLLWKKDPVKALAMHGESFAIATDTKIHITMDGGKSYTLPYEGTRALSFSPDGRYLAHINDYHELGKHECDETNPPRIRSAQTIDQEITDITWVGKHIICAAGPHVIVHDAHSLDRLDKRPTQYPKRINYISRISDQQVATTSDNYAGLWSVKELLTPIGEKHFGKARILPARDLVVLRGNVAQRLHIMQWQNDILEPIYASKLRKQELFAAAATKDKIMIACGDVIEWYKR